MDFIDRINSKYFSKQIEWTVFCAGGTVCFLKRGRIILKAR
jgi:hypothetical protein